MADNDLLDAVLHTFDRDHDAVGEHVEVLAHQLRVSRCDIYPDGGPDTGMFIRAAKTITKHMLHPPHVLIVAATRRDLLELVARINGRLHHVYGIDRSAVFSRENHTLPSGDEAEVFTYSRFVYDENDRATEWVTRCIAADKIELLEFDTSPIFFSPNVSESTVFTLGREIPSAFFATLKKIHDYNGWIPDLRSFAPSIDGAKEGEDGIESAKSYFRHLHVPNAHDSIETMSARRAEKVMTKSAAKKR